ncbi:hypothetical protein EV426DRAFT_708071 [Tirmania nivea]|nr:hypothetical protein EV426DRAFT_708071 [Tirmania nivea]
MRKSITERHSLPAMREIPRSGPAKANDIRFATLRGRNKPPVPLKAVQELQAKGGDPVINPTVSAPPNNLVTNTRGQSLLAPSSLSSLRGNRSHFVTSVAEMARESLPSTSHLPNTGSMRGKDYPENTVGSRPNARLGYDSAKPNSPKTTHGVALQSYRVARQNGARYVWEWGPKPVASSAGVQTPIDNYDRDASHPSTINLSQKTFHDTAHISNTLIPHPSGTQATPPYHTYPITVHGTTLLETPYLEAPRGPTPYPESRPATALSQNPRGISPFLGSRSVTPSTFRLKSLVKKTSQFFGLSNASSSSTALSASAVAVSIEQKQPKQGQKDKSNKTWKTKADIKTVTVQTQAQMFLDIARKAEKKGKTVYFASTTGSTFVLTNDSCAGAYTAISLSTANLAGQIAPSLMGAAELPPVDGIIGRKGLLFLLSPQQIMGLLPFEKVDVEKDGISQMHGFGAKTKLGQQYYEHEWQDSEDRRFTLTLHLAMVKVRGPGQLVGDISAVFWA